MQKVEQSINYQYFQISKRKVELQPKDGQRFQQFEEKQRRKLYINGQAKKLKKLGNYIRDLGVYRQMSPPSAALRAYCVPEEILKKLNEKDVIKSSQIRYQRMLKTATIKKNWSCEDLTILVWLVCKFCQTNSISIEQVQFHKECWEMIENMVTGTTADECLFKWMSFKKLRVTLYAWSKHEEELLRLLQSKYKGQQNLWKIISKQLFKLNTDENKIYRQPKQCREHFNSFLDPNIKKGIWTKQEDYMLMSAYLKFNCQRRWCQITQFFKNRTENSLKNRFQLLYSRLNITNTIEKSSQIDLLKKYTNQLREQIVKFCLEDEMTAEADKLRKQAFQGNFISFDAKNQVIQEKEQQAGNLVKKEQVFQNSNQYIMLKNMQKQDQTLKSPVTFDTFQQQNEAKYKTQTSIAPKSLQPYKTNIIIPQFEYKSNVMQENLFLNQNFAKQNRLSSYQNSSLHFSYFYQNFFCPPYYQDEHKFSNSKSVWK